ncbi:hypothetical protein [Sphingobium yanoikuyae]|uniref:hypothetical protein n=1 Tax=Sphingobium yanoikuyae TaxID=13690 RepID=UPI0028AC844A|nr:hypothetical protein [Sphingobium yanoikuyae]
MIDCAKYLTPHNILLIGGAIAGVIAAGLWFWSTFAAVTREQVVAKRTRDAVKKGETPKLGGTSIDGIDLMESLRKQSKINAAAALLTGLAIISQTVSSFID